MVTIANCQNLNEALMIQSVLRGSGIEAFIPDEFTVQNDWGLINAIGGIRILVDPLDGEKARDVLKKFEEDQGNTSDTPA